MTVSVIVPIYGVQAWIERCARSLLNQSVWQEIEYIFVNDGTTDASMEVLEAVLKDYPGRQVTIIGQENAGLPQARLAGLRRARGEYILHVDSDDWVEENMVERMLDAARANPEADMVFCQAYKEFGGDRRRLVDDKPWGDCRTFAREMLRFRAHGYLWNKLIKRSLYRDDLFYPTIGMHEDMVLLAQLLAGGGACVKVPEPLYHYRQDNAAAMSRQKKEKRDVDSARNFLQLISFLQEKGEAEPLGEALPDILLRCGWIACRLAPSLQKEFPVLRRGLLLLRTCEFSCPKQLFRLCRVKKWIGNAPFHCDRILCCIFNYNENDSSIAWSERLSPCFDTVILDSGSQPPCQHPTAVHLDNIYYSGLMNEAYRRAREGGYPWVMILTSDLGIRDRHVPRLRRTMERISLASNVGLYQPANGIFSRSHSKSKARLWGGIRSTNFQEGWFHLVPTELLGRICPIDTGINRLGWGLDMALSFFANREGRLILVDSSVRVHHPSGSGYNQDEADRQMKAWFKTIPGFRDPFHMEKARGPVRYPKL